MAAQDPNDITYCFLAEWYDEQAGFPRQYTLLYHMIDNTMAMNDLKNKRVFLKRSKFPSITMQDLFVGSTITFHARQMTILDYGNEFTRKQLAQTKTSVVALLKPSQMGQLGTTMCKLSQQGLKVGRIKSVRLTPAQAAQYGGPGSAELASGPSVAIEVIGPNCVSAVAEVVGTDVSGRSAEQDLKFFFESPLPSSAALTPDVSLCIIKPHMLLEGAESELVSIIQREGFTISAIQRFNFDRQAAKEFFHIYFDVVPYANNMVVDLQSGPCIAIEVKGENVHNKLRGLCGPSDPEIARYLRSNTIRAQYGKNVVINAVHCTDLEGDGPLECAFVFNTVQNSELVKTGCY